LTDEPPALTQEQAALELHDLLHRLGRNGFWYEIGATGRIRLTLCAELPPDVAGEIVELVRAHAVR